MIRSRIWGLAVAGVTLTVAACTHRGAVAEGPARGSLSPASDSGRELTADQQVNQVLNRLAFGPRPGDAIRVREMGVDRWIAQQLFPASIADDEAASFVARYAAYHEGPARLAVDYPRPEKIFEARRRRGDTSRTLSPDDSMQFKAAQKRIGQLNATLGEVKVGRAVITNRQLLDVMTDFWENHFNVDIRKNGQERYYLASYDRDIIRAHALGKFRDLLGAVAHSPAMLYYLDNWESVANPDEPTLVPQRVGHVTQYVMASTPRRHPQGLNENYGRELLELHTLGVDGGYTQHDVINVARAFTGWSIDRSKDPDGGGFVFRPQAHDAGEKVVLGHRLPSGRGTEDGEEVLDIVARHPATAHFIARKLCERFVSDSPPPSLVDRVAATFTATDGDLRQVMWTLATSPEFYARAAYRKKVKSPFELVVSALRAVGAQPDTTPRSAQTVAAIGEPIFQHQAPNGYPETGDSWMNTGAILSRINFGLAVAANRIPGASLDQWPGMATLRSASRAEQVDGVVLALLGGDVSPDTRQILISGEHPFLAAAQAASIDSATADTMHAPQMQHRGAPPPNPQGLAQVVGLALGSPEFQRR